MDAVHQVEHRFEPVAARRAKLARGIGARALRTTARARSARPCAPAPGRPAPGPSRSASRTASQRRRGAARGVRAARRSRPRTIMRTRSSGCGPCTPKWVTPLPKASRASRRSSGARLDRKRVREHRLPRQLARRQVGELPRLRDRHAIGVARLVLDACSGDGRSSASRCRGDQRQRSMLRGTACEKNLSEIASETA